MIDQINELPEDGLKSSPETSRYTENKWISQKNQNKLYFLHLISRGYSLIIRASNDIDMKLGAVAKLDKKNKATSKKVTTTSCQKL